MSGFELVNMVSNRTQRFQRLSAADQAKAISDLAAFLEENSSEEEFEADDTEEDPNYVPDGNASDAEADLSVEVADEYSSDDDESIADLGQQTSEAGSGAYYSSKSGKKWNKEPPPTGRIRAHNVVNFTQRRPGPAPGIVHDPLAIFKTIMSGEIAYIIIRETNRKGKELATKSNSEHPNSRPRVWNNLTLNEFHAYLGILLYAGCYRSNSEPVKELWGDTHLPLYKAAMSKKRFIAINRTIRFDNMNTRAARTVTSKTAAIDDVWIMMMANLEKAYTPHESVTVDEQLFPYRGRTRFTQYIPSKPAKYGLKVFWICDSKSFYPLKGMIYSGRQAGSEREVNQGQRVVLELVRNFERSGRTVYADNFFSSMELAQTLMAKELAYVGTVRSNKTFVPSLFLKHKSREVYSTLFGFCDGNVSLCSYVPKKNKAVLLISTVHYTTQVDDENIKKKPIAILDYNSNKCGVDTMDQMLGTYTCKRSTKRWPLAMFYNMTDIAALASYVIHNELLQTKESDRRRSFLKILSQQLVMPNMEERANNRRISCYPKISSALATFQVSSLIISIL